MAAPKDDPGGDQRQLVRYRRLSWRKEVWAGGLLVCSVLLLGAYFRFRPEESGVDRWLLGHPGQPVWVLWIVQIRQPIDVLVLSGVLAFWAGRHSLTRVWTPLLAPAFALASAELVVKPAVGRLLGDGLTFPSGSVVGAAALSMAAFVVVSGNVRWIVAIVGTLYTAAMAVAVVKLQWHFPTDALGGAAYGAGVVLLFDGLIGRHQERRRSRRRGRGVRPGSGDDPARTPVSVGS